MKLGLAAVVVLGASACGGGKGRLELVAVGATDYHAAPNKCSITDNAGGALEELTDHYKAKDGKGVVYKAVKPGTARIDCGEHNSVRIEVREVAKIALRRNDGSTTPTKVGGYAPTVCLVAFDKAGKELELGTLVEGVQITYSDHMSRVVDHGMGGAGSAACGSQQMTNRAGIAKVTGTWQGRGAATELVVIP